MRIFFSGILPLIFGIFSITTMGQESLVSGQVKDGKQRPVPFVNVLLLDAEDTVVTGTITEDDGTFTLSNLLDGDYKVKVRYIGFKDFTTEVFTLSQKRELPVITLKESPEVLGELTLKGRKPTVVRKSDRIVFNVENSILSSGSTMDILKRTPGLVVNQNEIRIRNEQVTVYLNNRKVQLNSEEIRALLESIGGAVIKSVEVIQNPPAEYDAEGGPVLNIISSKIISVGYKGSVSANGTYGIFAKHAFGTSHFFKSKKTNLFVNYAYNPRKQSNQTLGFIRYQNEGVTTDWDQDFERKEWTEAHSANLIFDYEASEKTTLSIAMVGLYSPNEFDFIRSKTNVTSSANSDFDIFSQGALNGNKSNVALDLSLNRKIEKGSIITNIHFTSFGRDRSQDLTSLYTDVNDVLFRTVSFSSFSEQDIEIYTGQVDFTKMLGKVNFQMGVKAAIIDSQSKIDFLNIDDAGSSGLDQAQNDDFLYDENVFAGYFSLEKDFGKWNSKIGLRAEQTNSKGTSLVLNTVNELDYLEFFPTAYLQYKASDNHSFSLDYSRRLDRPRYQDLNPFAYFLNENNFTQGNANLLPSFSNRFNLNYTLKDAYFFDVYYRDNGENIIMLPFQDNENQILRTLRQNALDSKSWGVDFTHGRSIADWFYFYTYVSAFHEEDTFAAVESGNGQQTNKVDGLYVFAGNYLTLDEKGTLTGELSLEYLSGFTQGSYLQKATTAINLGIRKTFWEKRGILSINFNDLLDQANARLTSRYLNQNNSYRVFNETQNIQLGFTYKFGNFKLEDNERTIETEEQGRLKEK